MIHQPGMPPFTRRDALKRFATGFGMAGFAATAGQPLLGAEVATGNPWMPRPPHFTGKAKHVIVVFLQGGLSQIDSFDYKPMLQKYDGKPLPYETPRTEFATGNLMKSPFSFKKYGQNGIEVSELFPHTAKVIDEFCIVRSMISDIPNHGPSVLMMNTGSVRAGRPSMGRGLFMDWERRTRICPASLSFPLVAGEADSVPRFCLPSTRGRWYRTTSQTPTARFSILPTHGRT